MALLARFSLIFQRTLASFGNIGLNNLKPAFGSNKPRKRVGRGIGSGGRTCGRGKAGQKSRSGPGIPRGFEGGQTPFYLRIPKTGKSTEKIKDLSLVGLDRIQRLVDLGRLNPTKPIDLRALKLAGVNFSKDGVRITGRGSEYFCSQVVLQMTEFTPDAIARIEALGGIAASVYHDLKGMVMMQQPRRPFWEKLMPPMTFRERVFYSQWENRGYLNPDMWERLTLADPNFEKRYWRAPSMEPVDRVEFPLNRIPEELREEGLLSK